MGFQPTNNATGVALRHLTATTRHCEPCKTQRGNHFAQLGSRARNDDLGFRQPERLKINAYRRCWWVEDPPYGVSYIFQAA
ncbi:MAG: hypothetical protein IJV35_06995 [Neisseriaceae bacterium]|nr:hypothetical protein [Neisseriaceae bacterium]